MLEEFRHDLKSLTTQQIYRKYIWDSDCFALSNDQHLFLKEDVCKNFQIEYSDIVIVGSAKLGFSIKPSRRFGAFNDDSDIDIAIVSTPLFERVWKDAYSFKQTHTFWPSSKSFFRYLSEGWIRPDRFPNSSSFIFTQTWWEFFRELTNSKKYGEIKISAGIYHSHFFLDKYQSICIDQCKAEEL